jgi:hypothetical protein
MSTHEEDLQRVFYINPDIRRFYNAKGIGDYAKIKSRALKCGADDAGEKRRGSFTKRLRSWSRGDKIALSIALTGLVALAATIVTLLIVAGLLVI